LGVERHTTLDRAPTVSVLATTVARRWKRDKLETPAFGRDEENLVTCSSAHKRNLRVDEDVPSNDFQTLGWNRVQGLLSGERLPPKEVE
jgi:hypothetical protein